MDTRQGFRFDVVWKPVSEWLGRNNGALQGLAALAVLLGVLWGVGRWLFQPPQLAITMVQTPLSFPSYLAGHLAKAIDRVAAKPPAELRGAVDSLKTASHEVSDFLEHTETFTKLTFRNNTDVSLHNVDVRIQEVYDLAGWGIDGDRLDEAERQQLLQSVHYDDGKRLVTLKSIALLPPKASVTLFIWGKVLRSDLLFPDQIVASYDGGHGEVVRSTEVTGLDAFIYSNSAILVLVVVLVNAAILSARSDKKKVAES